MEIQLLTEYFGYSLDARSIDVNVGIWDRPYSPYGNNIRFPESYFTDSEALDLANPVIAAQLAYEATHVWQRQHGEWATTRAVPLQIARTCTGGLFDPYAYDTSQSDPALLLGDFVHGSVEQQGTMVEDFVYVDRREKGSGLEL